MSERDEFDMLRSRPAPKPRNEAREKALEAALRSYDEKFSPAAQGTAGELRLTDRARKLWRGLMNRKLVATPAVAGLMILPLAGYAAWQFMDEDMFGLRTETLVQGEPVRPGEPAAEQEAGRGVLLNSEPAAADQLREAARPAPAAPTGMAAPRLQRGPLGGQSKMVAPSLAPAPSMDMPLPQVESRDRFATFDTNPVRAALENPVSTFSIDVDTASYAFVRRSLKEGFLPQADTVRVEEFINYFPYDWQGPASAEEPFKANVTVMPSPWNTGTKLLHIGIKGYDVPATARPAANLVFLIDTSGSMNAPDKLPLLKSAFRMLVNGMAGNDTISIVTYAGSAGTVLEPTKASEKQKIFDALERLEAGGSTAGAAGIAEAYRLAEKSFVAGGVNRVMLATDGDFNVGQTSDDALERMVEEKREKGVFLSVFGFGRGNYNDRMMQVLAQNGNGTAAYIDTLAEAEKTLVQEATATLFPIAKDVKIQVEFNPDKVAEYRLIGYETRALNREDFNNDRVDAGEIGSGHTVTAIYEITPKGSPAQQIDDLRYGDARVNNPGGIAGADEYAFVKIRYKQPDADTSKLITTPVTAANEIGAFGDASNDVRFSVAVAGFGQKLRKTDQLAGFGYDRITEIATAARDADPYGYRAEFLSLVRLASALDGGR